MTHVSNNGAPRLPFTRLAGIAAIGFAILIVAGNLITVPAGFPHAGSDIEEAAAFFGSHGDAVGLASALIPTAWVLAVLFGAGVFAATRGSEGDRNEAWSLVGLAGLILQNAAFCGVIAIRLALAATESAPPALWALHDSLFTLNGTFLALALLGLSVSGLRSGVVGRWHTGLGLVSAALLFGSATLTPWVIEHGGLWGQVGLAGWLLWVVWIVAYGVALVRWRAPGGGPRPR
ncbi:hypothetical protein [Nocardiopsis nanhaiensis]